MYFHFDTLIWNLVLDTLDTNIAKAPLASIF